MDSIGLLVFLLLFALILWFAHQAEKARTQEHETSIFAIFAYGSVVLFQFGLFLAGIGAQLAGVALTGRDSAELPTVSGLEGFDLNAINFSLIGVGLWVPALIGFLVLLPPVRRLVSRFINIQPENHVHAIALPNVALQPGSASPSPRRFSSPPSLGRHRIMTGSHYTNMPVTC